MKGIDYIDTLDPADRRAYKVFLIMVEYIAGKGLPIPTWLGVKAKLEEDLKKRVTRYDL